MKGGGPTPNGKIHLKFPFWLFEHLHNHCCVWFFWDYSIKRWLILILDSAVASIGLASAQSSTTNQVICISISRSICICWIISILLCICISTIYIPDTLVLLRLLVCLEHSLAKTSTRYLFSLSIIIYYLLVCLEHSSWTHSRATRQRLQHVRHHFCCLRILQFLICIPFQKKFCLEQSCSWWFEECSSNHMPRARAETCYQYLRLSIK